MLVNIEGRIFLCKWIKNAARLWEANEILNRTALGVGQSWGLEVGCGPFFEIGAPGTGLWSGQYR